LAGRKNVYWTGDSLKVLQGFPGDVLDALGHNLDLLQQGKSSPIAKVWSGQIWELRDDGADGKTYRMVYVAIIDNEVTVLHCFDKTTQQTSTLDSEKILARFKDAKKRKADLAKKRKAKLAIVKDTKTAKKRTEK
jgi:phage-related protein